MPPTSPSFESPSDGLAIVNVPEGAPAWVSASLIRDTIKIWQPYYHVQLHPVDALEMIMGASRLMDLVSSGDHHEAVRGTREGQQP